MNEFLVAERHAEWQMQFARERERLLAALKSLGDGGPVEDVQHIGATSVPDLPAQPCIDIAVSVWPFLLEERSRVALRDLGYEPVAGDEAASEQRFCHVSGQYQLFIVEAGGDRWLHHVLFRDYVRATAEARLDFATLKQAAMADPIGYRLAKDQWFATVSDTARQWWLTSIHFAPPLKVAQDLAGLEATWYISSGWAMDLFLGRVTRLHHDVDVVVARAQQMALHKHLTERGWKLLTSYDRRLEPWPPHMTLELPRHQVHAHRDGELIDILLGDFEHDLWRYRRNPAIVRTIERAGLQYNGLPYLAPELVLLFKSQNTSDRPRPQDQIDFDQVCAHLEPERRAWLRWALLASAPAHPWIAQLT